MDDVELAYLYLIIKALSLIPVRRYFTVLSSHQTTYYVQTATVPVRSFISHLPEQSVSPRSFGQSQRRTPPLRAPAKHASARPHGPPAASQQAPQPPDAAYAPDSLRPRMPPLAPSIPGRGQLAAAMDPSYPRLGRRLERERCARHVEVGWNEPQRRSGLVSVVDELPDLAANGRGEGY